jgi:hypothetical protein
MYGPVRSRTRREERRRAAMLGWTRTPDGGDLCPQHSGAGAENEEGEPLPCPSPG